MLTDPFNLTIVDELLTAIRSERLDFLNFTLSAKEQADGYLVYRAPNNALAELTPNLRYGDHVVVRKLTSEEQTAIEPDAVCLLLVEYPETDFNSAPYKAHHFMWVVGNQLPWGGPLIGFEDDEFSEPWVIPRFAPELLEVWLVTRSMRQHA